jgi:hypothetical protein
MKSPNEKGIIFLVHFAWGAAVGAGQEQLLQTRVCKDTLCNFWKGKRIYGNGANFWK